MYLFYNVYDHEIAFNFRSEIHSIDEISVHKSITKS